MHNDSLIDAVLANSIPATMCKMVCGDVVIVNAEKTPGQYLACDECGHACEIADTVPTFIASLA